MLKSRHIAIIIPFAVGLASAAWTTISFWYDLKEGLIAFLGLIAASLIQVMPVTANFLQSDRLRRNDVIRLNKSLKRQQYYWIGLLSATLVAFCIVVIAAALKSRVHEFPILFRSPWILSFDWEAVLCFLVAASVAFVLLQIKNMFGGILSLHELRAEIVLASAQEPNREKSPEATPEIGNGDASVVHLPSQYGKIVSP